jgi:hypothetical protein
LGDLSPVEAIRADRFDDASSAAHLFVAHG